MVLRKHTINPEKNMAPSRLSLYMIIWSSQGDCICDGPKQLLTGMPQLVTFFAEDK